MQIDSISADELATNNREFCDLLRDAVTHGASIGFMLPLADNELSAYWTKVATELSAGQKILLAARDTDGRIIGSAQLALESRANGRHRAEIQKVMVLNSHRRKAVGAALMQRLEQIAHDQSRRLLFLDTSAGKGGAVKFYERLGYTFAGGIPDYAADPDGQFVPNAIFYKKLT